MYLDKFHIIVTLVFVLFYNKCEGTLFLTGKINVGVIEGQVVRVACSNTGSAGGAFNDPVIKDYNGVVVQNSSHIQLTRIDTPTNKTLVVTWNPILLSDSRADGYACDDGSSQSVAFHLYIFPNASIPNVVLKKTIGKNIGSKFTLTCNASMDKASLVSGLNMELKWVYYKSGNGSDITSEATSITKTVGNVLNIDSTITRSLGFNTFGYYRCEARATLTKSHTSFDFQKTAIVALPATVENGVKTKQEVKVKKGKNVKFVCQVASFPAANVTWKRKDHVITAASNTRYKFSDYQNSKNGILDINDVDYADRAVYTCNASNTVSSATIQFTLRVRDPLGALWPFIGIVIEAIVLAVLIIVYERYKERNGDKRKSKGDKKDGKEVSPLLPKDGEPGVEYTSGTNGGSAKLKTAEEVQA